MGDCGDLNHLSNKDIIIIIISNIKIKITKNYKFFLKLSKNYLCVLFWILFSIFFPLFYSFYNLLVNQYHLVLNSLIEYDSSIFP